jgi:hypothetical protein
LGGSKTRSLERPDADDVLRGRALVAASFLAFYRGQLESARSMVTEGLAAAVRAHDTPTEARGLRFEAVIEQRMGIVRPRSTRRTRRLN